MYFIDVEENGQKVTYVPCAGQSLEEVLRIAKEKNGLIRRHGDGGLAMNPLADVVIADYSK